MLRLIRYIVAVVAFTVGGGYALSAQELRLGADFVTLFDNTEYASMQGISSGTLFGSRLTPKLGVAWDEHNELMVAVDLLQNFGHDMRLFSDVDMQLYYAYRAPRVTALAGIFPRSEMRGLQSQLFFDRSYRFFNSRISGVLARYEDHSRGDSYIEFAMDYTGMRDFDTRESFSIMSSGCMDAEWLYFGYDFSMGHYAKDYNPVTRDGVVDNLLLAPYLGYRCKVGAPSREVHFDLRLQYVQSLQRDRVNENRWLSPSGAEIYVAVEWCDIRLSNRYYVGRGVIFPYYDRYSADLYYGMPLYGSKQKIYESLELSYSRRFFDDTVALEAGITIDYEGTGWGTRQWLQLSVDLDYKAAFGRVKNVNNR